METPAILKVESKPVTIPTTGNYQGYNVQTIVVSGSTATSFNFSIPRDCYQLLDAELLLFTGTAISGASIDTDTKYFNDWNGAIDQYSGSGNTTKNLLGHNKINRIPFISQLTSAQAGTFGSLDAAFNSTGTYYPIGLEISYIPY
jgi:hypothetical protein